MKKYYYIYGLASKLNPLYRGKCYVNNKVFVELGKPVCEFKGPYKKGFFHHPLSEEELLGMQEFLIERGLEEHISIEEQLPKEMLKKWRGIRVI